MNALKHGLLALVLLPATLFGQANFKQGKITSLNGTSRDAEVRVITWIDNPRSFVFKTSGELEQQATLENTASVQIIDGRRFERAIVNKSLNRIRYPRIPSRPDNRTVGDTVFLELLTEGSKVALLSLTDSIKTRYFIRKAGGAAEELRYQIYRAREQGGKVIEIATYREQLTNIATGSSMAAITAINRAKYAREDLLGVMDLLNNGETDFRSKAAHGPVRLMAGAGVAYNTFTFSGEAGIAGSDPDKIVSVFPLIGIEWTLNPENPNAVIQLTGQAVQAKAAFYSTNQSLEETKNFTQWSYSLSPVYLYRFFNKQNFKIVAGAGLSANVFQYSDDRTTLRQVEVPGSRPTPSVNEDGFQKFSFSVPVRAGVSLGNVDAMITWSKELTNLVTLMETSLSMSRASVSVAYVFGR
ncbi:hypothetical protein [Pedobacter sp. SYP-B3415]|uniref:hypothetical protein n=1 Tax=Pedobacter sp. SYP-B3415 TaxID=2496641 RepID=UPI00101C0A45|nr:hypothetical protein [Pedobacter sp. SYP-B3415]